MLNCYVTLFLCLEPAEGSVRSNSLTPRKLKVLCITLRGLLFWLTVDDRDRYFAANMLFSEVNEQQHTGVKKRSWKNIR